MNFKSCLVRWNLNFVRTAIALSLFLLVASTGITEAKVVERLQLSAEDFKRLNPSVEKGDWENLNSTDLAKISFKDLTSYYLGTKRLIGDYDLATRDDAKLKELYSFSRDGKPVKDPSAKSLGEARAKAVERAKVLRTELDTALAEFKTRIEGFRKVSLGSDESYRRSVADALNKRDVLIESILKMDLNFRDVKDPQILTDRIVQFSELSKQIESIAVDVETRLNRKLVEIAIDDEGWAIEIVDPGLFGEGKDFESWLPRAFPAQVILNKIGESYKERFIKDLMTQNRSARMGFSDLQRVQVRNAVETLTARGATAEQMNEVKLVLKFYLVGIGFWDSEWASLISSEIVKVFGEAEAVRSLLIEAIKMTNGEGFPKEWFQDRTIDDVVKAIQDLPAENLKSVSTSLIENLGLSLAHPLFQMPLTAQISELISLEGGELNLYNSIYSKVQSRLINEDFEVLATQLELTRNSKTYAILLHAFGRQITRDVLLYQVEHGKRAELTQEFKDKMASKVQRLRTYAAKGRGLLEAENGKLTPELVVILKDISDTIIPDTANALLTVLSQASNANEKVSSKTFVALKNAVDAELVKLGQGIK